MKLDIALTRGSVDSASPLIAVAYQRAVQLEGSYVTEAFEIDGYSAILKVSGDKAVVIISGGSNGVVLHPRTGEVKLFSYTEYQFYRGMSVAVPKKVIYGVAGGWRDGTKAYDTENIYPMDLGNNASFGLEKVDDNLEGEFLGTEGNYGNLYWWNGDEEEPVFLSWKGTPTRHFRLGSGVSIPGFTVQETASPGLLEDTPYFTSFGQHIYQDGKILQTAPRYNWPYSGQDRCFILGAAQDSDGIIWAVMQSDRYYVPRYVAIFSDGYRITGDDRTEIEKYLSDNEGVTIVFEKEYETKRGIYTVLWKTGGPIDGWTWVAEWNTGRVGLPWFGNQLSTSFINPEGVVITTDGTKTEQAHAQGTYKESSAQNIFLADGNVMAQYTDKTFFEYSANTPVSGTVSLSFLVSRTKTDTEQKMKIYKGTFPSLRSPSDPDPVPLWFQMTSFTTHYVVVGQPFIASAAGGQGSYTYSYTGFSVNDSGIVTSVSCGGGSAMGTVTVADECGDSITREVRLQGGTWVLTSQQHATCTDPNCSSTPCRYSQGGACGYFWVSWGHVDLTVPEIKALYDAEYNAQPDSSTAGGSYTVTVWRWPSNSTTTSNLGNTTTPISNSSGGTQKWLVVEKSSYEYRCP
jgi:hypothetical protein